MSTGLYTRFYLRLVAQRRGVFLALFFFGVIGIIISSRLNLEEDVLAILPQGDRMVDDYQYVLRKFRQIDRVYFDIGTTNNDPDTLAAVADEFHARLVTNSTFTRVTYRFQLHGQGKITDFLTGALPVLFTEPDAQALAAKLEPAVLREHLITARRQLGGLEGMVMKDIIAADPIGMSSLVLAKVQPLQTGFGNARIEEGRLLSADGRHVLMVAEPNFPSSNSSKSAALLADLQRLIHETETTFPGVRIALTGGHRMTLENASLIKSDATRCILLGTIAMLALCLTAFRRRWLAAVTFLPSFFGGLAATVVLALWQKEVSAIAIGFAVIAIGITVDYAIHVIYHLDNAAGLTRHEVGEHVGRLVMPISVGALTSAVAFVVMATSPMRGYQQLGLFGAMGVVVSAAFAVTFIPLMVPIPKAREQAPLWLTRSLQSFFDWRARWLLWLVLGVVALSVVTAFGVRRLRFEGDIARLNGVSAAAARDEATLREVWGDALGMTLVVARARSLDEALQLNDRAAASLAQGPNAGAFYSLAAICPSLPTQETNVVRWQAFWTPARRTALTQLLPQLGAELGYSPDAFALFWQRLQSEPARVSVETFRNTPLEQVMSERVALGTNDYAVSTLLKIKDPAELPALRQALPGLIVLDKKAFANHIAALAKEGMQHFALWSGILVTAILYFSLGSIELVLATLVPLAFGLLWTFGLMGLFGLPIDIMNSVFVIFIIGMGEDYGVFLVTGKLDEWRGLTSRLAATSASVLISALTTLFGFAVLAFAQHPVLFSVGTTVLLGMLCTITATLILTPLCMDLLLFRPPPRGAPRWWHVFGTLWATLHLGGSEIFLFCVLRPILKLVAPGTADDKLRRATSWGARLLVKSFPFGKLEFQNITPATFERPAIIISNHQSAVDVLLMISLPGDVRMTAKKRVWDTPLLGVGCKVCGHVMVEPNNPQATLERCRAKLAEGASLHFFPEGTRSLDGNLLRFHRGAFELAVQLQQDILPIVLCDSWTAVPRDAYWFEPYHTTMRAWPRITPQTFDYSLGARALMRHCEEVVATALREQLEQINTPRLLRRKVGRLYRYQGKFVEQFVYWKMKGDPLFAALHPAVPRQGFILDLGCGYGVPAHWLFYASPDRTVLGVDYDDAKILVAQRTAQDHPRIQFQVQDILTWAYPPCDVVLLLDVLHYWAPEVQGEILRRACRALRLGGSLILREAARAEGPGHERVERWEKFATCIGHNKAERLHFQTRAELMSSLQRAGFGECVVQPGGGRDSNVLIVARPASS